MNYGLWLLHDETGTITLTGWSETTNSTTNPDDPTKTEHWPSYTLCTDRNQLPDRLAELGIDLAAGHHLDDLDKDWDVYVRRPDITALRTLLDTEKSRWSENVSGRPASRELQR